MVPFLVRTVLGKCGNQKVSKPDGSRKPEQEFLLLEEEKKRPFEKRGGDAGQKA